MIGHARTGELYLIKSLWGLAATGRKPTDA
jgi:hypothetical protein